jgi:hypothetical protein
LHDNDGVTRRTPGRLDLSFTYVTDAGIEEFQNAPRKVGDDKMPLRCSVPRRVE